LNINKIYLSPLGRHLEFEALKVQFINAFVLIQGVPYKNVTSNSTMSKAN